MAETDMCVVDAIQYLTGCTLGKGNLVHMDYGKMAFSFFDRNSGKGLRAVLRPETRKGMDGELTSLMRKLSDQSADEDERRRAAGLRKSLQERYMGLPLERMFSIQWLDHGPPSPPRILESLACDDCGERTIESRTMRLDGRTLCIPCFSKQAPKG